MFDSFAGVAVFASGGAGQGRAGQRLMGRARTM